MKKETQAEKPNNIVNGEDQNLVINSQEEEGDFSTSDNLEKSYEQGMGNENISNNDRVNDDDDDSNEESEEEEEELPGEYDDSEKTVEKTPKMK
jgi:hypothetical protein